MLVQRCCMRCSIVIMAYLLERAPAAHVAHPLEAPGHQPAAPLVGM